MQGGEGGGGALGRGGRGGLASSVCAAGSIGREWVGSCVACSHRGGLSALGDW